MSKRIKTVIILNDKTYHTFYDNQEGPDSFRVSDGALIYRSGDLTRSLVVPLSSLKSAGQELIDDGARV